MHRSLGPKSGCQPGPGGAFQHHWVGGGGWTSRKTGWLQTFAHSPDRLDPCSIRHRPRWARRPGGGTTRLSVSRIIASAMVRIAMVEPPLLRGLNRLGVSGGSGRYVDRPWCCPAGSHGDQAVGRAVAGDGGPSGQAPVQPYRRRGVRAARRWCGRAGSDRAIPVDCRVDLLRRRGAFLPAGPDAGQPVVAAAGGVAGGCGHGGAGSGAGIDDGPIDGHWHRGRVVPFGLRRRYLPDRRKGTSRRKRACRSSSSPGLGGCKTVAARGDQRMFALLATCSGCLRCVRKAIQAWRQDCPRKLARPTR